MRLALVLAILFASTIAHADDKVLVLKAEGRADKKVRVKIEGAVLRLAKTTSESTTAGDVTYGDAATMVGCKPEEDKCKDEVLGMLAVDEIVTITATPKPGGIEVAVKRISKGAATKTGQTLVTADSADQLDALAPVFGKAGPASPLPPPVASTTTAPPPPVEHPKPAPPAPQPQRAPDPLPVTPEPVRTAEPTPTPAMPQPVDEPETTPNRRLPMIGMIGGGVMIVVGAVFWASASGIEDEIKDAPKRTRADLEHVKDLEAEGDTYATAGNVLAIGGLIIGGVSTYYFLKAGKKPSRSASVTPIIGNGTGLAVTWGGSL